MEKTQTRNQTKDLYFVALLLPPDIAAIANHWKQYCAENFSTQGAFNSPPHITLQPPFQWSEDSREQLKDFLQSFAENNSEIPITLQGFGCFEPRVIFIDVQQTPELLVLQKNLKSEFEERFNLRDKRYGDRPFHPHATIAFKDLTKENFYRAWLKFQDKSLHHNFKVSELTLLKHNGQVWEVDSHFSFKYLCK